jgi:hypothetical protein
MEDISIWQKTGHFYFALTAIEFVDFADEHNVTLKGGLRVQVSS